jgi:prepilin-type N-terminal cleavage/methylation domain-containing protein
MAYTIKMTKNNSFTVMELVVVLTIIGILSSIALMNFGKTKENAYVKEAKVNLQLITAAEKVYRLEIGGYVNGTNVGELNPRLRLLLPADNAHWNYKVVNAAANTFTGKAGLASNGNVTAWCINESSAEPYNASCFFN